MIKRAYEKQKKTGINKIMKKNQVVILTLALMLMTAGYMNYTNNHENENVLLAQLGDAKLVSTNVAEINEIVNENTNETQVENNIQNQTETNNIEENKVEEETSNNNVVTTSTNNVVENQNAVTNQEVQETSNNAIESTDDYFTKSKLERETMYSQMLETYQKILENEKIASDQKDIAENEIKNINDKKNAIMIVENLLKTKDFEKAVVFINEQSVNVVVKGEKLETEQVAQIQNIIQRELKTNIENIHITTRE